MSNFKIVTDSCCDFTEQMYQEYDVACAPLTVLYKGVAYDNFSEDARLKELYDGIRAGEMPTTSAVNIDGWSRVMKPALEAGKDVMAICFTGALSTTYQSAVIASTELKEEYPDRKIVVIDSLCAALGQGLLVMHACAHRDAGESLEEVAAWVEANKLHVCHEVTVDDLFHLKRGGRISATTALVGTMLNIKPMLVINNEGKLESVAKARGRKAAMETLAKKLGSKCIDKELAIVAHGDCPEDAEMLANIIKEKYGVKKVHIGYVGAVIGAHTGPGVLVAFFMGDKR